MNTQDTTTKISNGASEYARNIASRVSADERTLSHGVPSRTLLGGLPLARLIPQDVHSIADYADGMTVGGCAMLTDDPAAKLASIVLGASVIGVSAMTDYRLSAVKLIPIEAHEAIDHLWGLSCIAAPFVLGYWKRAPKVAMTHVMVGIGTILTSLFTDYRSIKRQQR